MSRKRINKQEVHVLIHNIIPCLHLYYPKENVDRNYDQIYKRNNWLKRHGIPKRRKPFIQGVVHEWEYEKILVAMQKNGLPVEKELDEARQWLKRNKIHSRGEQ